MNSLSVGSIVFALVFGGALLGMQMRRILPQEHFSPDARDAIKVSMAMIATLAALVLGLLTASASNAFGEKETELRNMSGQVILLDRVMDNYGPETAEARTLLKQMMVTRINQVWPEESGSTVAPEAISRGVGVEIVQQKLLALSPKNDAQRWLQSTALNATRNIATARWSVLEHIGSTIQWPLLVVMVFWLIIIFASFGLFAPRNASVIVMLFVAALSVASAIYMIFAMDQPYGGLLKLSSEPLRIALSELGR